MEKTKNRSLTKPSLRVPLSKKIAKDFEYTKTVMDYFLGSCTFFDVGSGSNDERDLQLFYDAYNLKLPPEYFNYVVNPLNAKKAEHKNWPARVRNFSILRPNLDLLEGEYEKRPFNFVVKVNNPDAVNQAQDKEYQALVASLEQMFINSLNNKGADTGQPSQEVEIPEKIRGKIVSNFRDERAVMGEAALNILIDDLALEETFKRMFKDWLIAGETYSYKGVRRKEVVHERVSPEDIDHDKSPDFEYIEDGQWVVRRMYMTMGDIVDNWYDELTAKEIDIIENESGGLSFRGMNTAGLNQSRTDQELKRSSMPVHHVVWKYLTKIGILSYANEITGEIEEMEVPETFVAQEGESIEWYWVNEVWEGYKLLDDLYVGIQPVPVQRNQMNNLSACKLPYNGKKFSEVHSRNISILEMGIPYEVLHRVLHYNLEKTIAKSKGKIVLLDQNAIPKKDGWSEEKFFYWADANGYGILNRNQIGVDKSFNQYTVLDMSLYADIANMIEVMNAVKQEWDDLLGISRQRKGKVEASETASGASTASYNSSVISERVFSRFEEFVQRELAGLIDCSKLAWIDGKKRLWYGDDMRSQILDVEPGKFAETEYGIYVSKSPRDIRSLEMVRQQIQAFAQNGMPPSTLIDVVRARSLSKLQVILKQKEAESIAQNQAVIANEQEAEERKLAIEGRFKELEGYIAERLIHVEYDRKEDVEMLKLSGVDQNIDPIIDPGQAQKLSHDADMKERELSLKRSVESRKAAQKDRELSIKEKELVVRKEIADKQAKVAMKNKVTGEK